MFIQNIKINEIRHLKNFNIEIGKEKKHLIITGKNGSGKTTLLEKIHDKLNNIRNGEELAIKNYQKNIQNYQKNIKNYKNNINGWKDNINTYQDNINTYQNNINSWKDNINSFQKKIKNSEDNIKNYQNNIQNLENNIKSYQNNIQSLENNIKSYQNNIQNYSKELSIKLDEDAEIVTEKMKKFEVLNTFFSAKRTVNMAKSNGVEIVNLNNIKSSSMSRNANYQTIFLKYLVHLQTQLSYATTDNDEKEVKKIKGWFNRFTSILRELFENEDIELKYDRKNYNFKIFDGEKEFDFLSLSDGFSSVIDVITSIILLMEKDEEQLHDYDMSGIVLIDEVETHLHISLQNKILKVLDKIFPNIQFIVTTHSPFVLNSIPNCVLYDLEHKEKIEDLTPFSYDVIVETYFGQDKYKKNIQNKITKYEQLAFKSRTDAEEDEFYDLRNELIKITSPQELMNKFNNIEERRKNV